MSITLSGYDWMQFDLDEIKGGKWDPEEKLRREKEELELERKGCDFML